MSDAHGHARPIATLVSDRALFLVTKSRVEKEIDEQLARALGYGAPARISSCTRPKSGDGFCLRYGPHQWFVAVETARAADARASLDAALSGRTVAVFPYEGGLFGLRVKGVGVASVLSKGTLIDLRDKSFPPGSGTRTLFAGQPTFVVREATDVYELYYDGSLDHAMRQWFSETAMEIA